MAGLLTYGRAALPLVPLASRLPYVSGGGGGEMPSWDFTKTARVDHDHLAQYARVCGFRLGASLPVTYPHLLGFDMTMEGMVDGTFPIPAIGLVHVENRITQHRPLGTEEELTTRITLSRLRPHPKGRVFDVATSVSGDGGEVAWEETSTMLRRGGSSGFGTATPDDGPTREDVPSALQLPERSLWKVGGDLGRRYGAVSGDRNPIHITGLTARAFGFPSAIAHGMWTKARCLAALQGRLPDAYTVAVAFKTPIKLPGTVVFASTPTQSRTHDGPIGFGVRSRKGAPHLDGVITPKES